MSDWAESALADLVSVQKGRKVATLDYCADGFEAYLGADVISGGSPSEFADPGNAVTAADSDILMLWDGERSGLVGKGRRGVVSSTSARLSPNQGIDVGFLYYALDNRFQWIQGRRTGTGIPHVPKDIGRILRISHPTQIEKQRKIAEILSTVDEAIEQTEKLIAKHQQIKAGLMHDLFTRGLTPDGHLRPPHTECPSLYKDSPLGPIPKDWEIQPLRSCLREAPRNGLYKPAELIGKGVLLVGQTAITDEREINLGWARRVQVTPEERALFALEEGDILVSRVFATLDGVGQPALLGPVPEPAVYESNMMCLHVDRKKTDSLLLFEWLRSPFARQYMVGRANASNQASVNQQVLNPLPVAVQQYNEQTLLVERIRSLRKRRACETQKLEKLRALRSGLMHDLLTGRVEVPASDDSEEAA